MRNYEVAYIADPDLDEQSLETLQTKVQGWISAAGGKPGKIDAWGRRRLAYPIKKKTDGFYVFVKAEMPADGPLQIERELRLNEDVIRFLVTSLESE
ncbi:MAG: 30S ribosomal protein S6 [Anaerolineales bacterium]|jgi:small subunit ribosomal protein S6